MDYKNDLRIFYLSSLVLRRGSEEIIKQTPIPGGGGEKAAKS